MFLRLHPLLTAAIFAGIHSLISSTANEVTRFFCFPWRLVRHGASVLRDYRISSVMHKGEALEQFAASMHLVLDLG
jgi:hypothetical protein